MDVKSKQQKLEIKTMQFKYNFWFNPLKGPSVSWFYQVKLPSLSNLVQPSTVTRGLAQLKKKRKNKKKEKGTAHLYVNLYARPSILQQMPPSEPILHATSFRFEGAQQPID